jgi:hypothetical protein
LVDFGGASSSQTAHGASLEPCQSRTQPHACCTWCCPWPLCTPTWFVGVRGCPSWCVPWAFFRRFSGVSPILEPQIRRNLPERGPESLPRGPQFRPQPAQGALAPIDARPGDGTIEAARSVNTKIELLWPFELLRPRSKMTQSTHLMSRNFFFDILGFF